ncbi:MAG: hypothetical protein LBR27_07615 [Bifidobacteriaceae bacterium]|nr:hypothetical protein [Bifidobacteriaceae bacterium]
MNTTTHLYLDLHADEPMPVWADILEPLVPRQRRGRWARLVAWLGLGRPTNCRLAAVGS